MEQVEQRNTEEIGNTKGQSPNFKCRKWCFTINNPSEEDKKAIESLNCKHIYQLEKGEQMTQHYQGFLEFKNPISFSSMKKKLNRAHLEKCNNTEASKKYCQKTEGRILGPWIKGYAEPVKTITKFRPWQEEIIKMISEKPDDRTIHWFFDEIGGQGKTCLAKYLCLNYNCVYATGKSSDIKYLLHSLFENDESRKNSLIVIFDLTRSIENYVSYQAIEEVKNGIFMNTKYECKQHIFNSPWVLVFANFEPDYERLSADRWKVKTLNE